jgi:hypothetical protein
MVKILQRPHHCQNVVSKDHNSIFYYVQHDPLDLNLPTQDDKPFTLGIQTSWHLEIMQKFRHGNSIFFMQHLAQIKAGYAIYFIAY